MSTDTIEKTTPTAQTVEALTAKAGECDRERATALAELEQVESGAGAQMLDDPESAGAVTRRMGELRARIDLAGRAAGEARQRAQDARVADLLAQADALTPDAAKAAKALAVHDEKREKLLAALVDFTGLSWVEHRPEIAMTGPCVSRDVRAGLVRTLQGVQSAQERLRRHADAAAADPDWVPPEQAAQAERRGEWRETVAGYRADLEELSALTDEADERAQSQGISREEFMADTDGGWGSSQTKHLLTRLPELKDRIEAFPQDVEFFRGQGLDLPDDEVSALKVELGLEDE